MKFQFSTNNVLAIFSSAEFLLITEIPLTFLLVIIDVFFYNCDTYVLWFLSPVECVAYLCVLGNAFTYSELHTRTTVQNMLPQS